MSDTGNTHRINLSNARGLWSQGRRRAALQMLNDDHRLEGPHTEVLAQLAVWYREIGDLHAMRNVLVALAGHLSIHEKPVPQKTAGLEPMLDALHPASRGHNLTARFFTLLGEGAYEVRGPDNAVRLFHAARDLDPLLLAAQVGLGRCLLQLGKTRRCLSEMVRAAEGCRPAGPLWALAAQAAQAENDSTQAQGLWARALEADPGDPVAACHCAAHALTQSNLPRASQILKEALRLMPNDARLLRAGVVVHLAAGVSAGASVEIREARRLARALVKADRADASSLVVQAVVRHLDKHTRGDEESSMQLPTIGLSAESESDQTRDLYALPGTWEPLRESEEVDEPDPYAGPWR